MTRIPSPLPAHITDESWKFLGNVVKARREFIGLSQEDLALYGGPKKTTVSKLERGAEPHPGIRSQQAIERVLGWERGTIREILALSVSDDAIEREVCARDFIEDELPDLTAPLSPGAATARDLTTRELLDELERRLALAEGGDGNGSPAPTSAPHLRRPRNISGL